MCTCDITSLLPKDLKCKLGDKLGKGVDGDVFCFGRDKVIKIAKINYGDISTFKEVMAYLKTNKLSLYASVDKYDYIGLVGNNHYCYYVTEKLKPLSEDEWKVFHSIISHEDRNIVKNYSDAKIKEILFGLSCGLDFDVKSVTFFCTGLRQSPLKHLDLHPRNIMKDSRGYFKLVDFNRMKMENY
jgi:serine/threonine protein kinase